MTFDESRLKDPGFFRENRLDPHSDHAVQPAYRLSLNGLWKIRPRGQSRPGNPRL